MATISEIAADVYRISTFVPRANLHFSQFVLRDEEPVLVHTGPRRFFPEVRAAVAQLLDPTKLRWLAISHFEADECGALDEWLTLAPGAQAISSSVAAVV